MSNAAVLESLEAKWKRDPHSRVFFRYADELRKAQQYQTAIEVCEVGLESHSQYLPALICLARCYEHIADLERASELYRRIVAQDPNNPHALTGLSFYFESVADYPAAIQYAESLALLQPSESLSLRIQELQRKNQDSSLEEHELLTDSEDLDAEIESREHEALQALELAEGPPKNPVESLDQEQSFNTLPNVEMLDDDLISSSTLEKSDTADQDDKSPNLKDGFESDQEAIDTADVFAAKVEQEFDQSLAEAETEEIQSLKKLNDSVFNKPEDDASAFAKHNQELQITRALKHEKMEHYEEAIEIYRLLMGKGDSNQFVAQGFERVQGILSTESKKSRKMRSLNIWLEKIKGVYHVS